MYVIIGNDFISLETKILNRNLQAFAYVIVEERFHLTGNQAVTDDVTIEYMSWILNRDIGLHYIERYQNEILKFISYKERWE